jgi:plasmid stability protein
MADVTIRKLDDWVVASFRARAKQAGRSLEEELRQFLTEAARERRRRFADKLEAFAERLRSKYGEMPDSTPSSGRGATNSDDRAGRERHGKMVCYRAGQPAARSLVQGNEELVAPELTQVEVASPWSRKRSASS